MSEKRPANHSHIPHEERLTKVDFQKMFTTKSNPH